VTGPDHDDAGDGEELPLITADVIDDDEVLAVAVDAFIAANPVARERQAEIDFRREALRLLPHDTDGMTWGYFVLLDELVNERWADLALDLVRLGYAAGKSQTGVAP
jgi:hypothetical protein